MSTDVKDEFQGAKYRVVHCSGALESFFQSLTHVETHKGTALKRGMVQQIQRLADGHRMSRENFPREGELPKRIDGSSAGYFFALKMLPIRGYCWQSDSHPNTWFISHYVYKDYQKLKKRDETKVAENWTRIEVGGNER